MDDIQYDKTVFPIVSGQISVSCCGREMNDDNTFRSFGKVFEEAYPVVCLPITTNDEGIMPRLRLKGFVGGYGLDRDYENDKNTGKPVDVRIDSAGAVIKEIIAGMQKSSPAADLL